MVAERITNMPSQKHSGKRQHTLMLTVHSAETPLEPGYAQSVTQNWLNRPDVEASINAFAGPDTLVRSVHTDYAAWHASWANSLTVGYEMTGYAAFSRAQWLTPNGQNMIDRLAREMAMDAKIYGIPLRWLSNDEVNQIRNGNRSIKGLATHAQIDPANRTDPGAGFPYDVLMACIRVYSGVAVTTPTVPPVVPPTPSRPVRKTYGLDQIHWSVNKNDTLSRICQYYYGEASAATLKRLCDYNGILVTDKLTIGERIWIPGRLVWNPIRQPDTIRTIAAYYGLDPGYLANLNGLGWNPDATIYVGNYLVVKAA